jgi:hypothetical protein
MKEREGFDSPMIYEPFKGQSSLTCWKKRKKSKKDAGRAVRREKEGLGRNLTGYRCIQ